MSPSLKRQTPRTIAIGGVCLVGFGLAGCARETGLDILARQDAKTDSAVAEVTVAPVRSSPMPAVITETPPDRLRMAALRAGAVIGS